MGWFSNGSGLVELYMRLWRKGVISFVRLQLRVFSGSIVKGGGRISLELGGEVEVIWKGELIEILVEGVCTIL